MPMNVHAYIELIIFKIILIVLTNNANCLNPLVYQHFDQNNLFFVSAIFILSQFMCNFTIKNRGI